MESGQGGCTFETLANYAQILGVLAGIGAGLLVARGLENLSVGFFSFLLLALLGGILGWVLQKVLIFISDRLNKPLNERPVTLPAEQQLESSVSPARPSAPQLQAIIENRGEIPLGLSQGSTSYIGRARTMQELRNYLLDPYGITAPGCLIRIPEKSDYDYCSRYHAWIERQDDTYVLHNRSRNGTHVDGARVPASGARLTDGALIALAPPDRPETTTIRFRFEMVTPVWPLRSFHDRLFEGRADAHYAESLENRRPQRWENAGDAWQRLGEDLRAKQCYEKAANSAGGSDRARCYEKLAILTKTRPDLFRKYLESAALADGSSLIQVREASVESLRVGDPARFRLSVTNSGQGEARQVSIVPIGGSSFLIEPPEQTHEPPLGPNDGPWQPEFRLVPNAHGSQVLTFHLSWWDRVRESRKAVEVQSQSLDVAKQAAPPVSGEKVFMGPVAMVDGDVGFVRQDPPTR
jgi:hypothetical protein